MKAKILLISILLAAFSPSQGSSPVHPHAGKETDRTVVFVAPMISTRWGEGCFYNNACPNDASAAATCLHAPAGSGAIAMAQLMKYYQYPLHGTGEHGYTHPVYGIQYANFSAANYNYAAMPDSLTAPGDQVATLVYHCGVSQNMNYGPLISSSDSSLVDTALVKYFGFPETAVWKWKSNYSITEWEAMLRAELDAGHPLLYCATNGQSGKSYFLCDGYSSAAYFHFNWGNGGAFDGYYYLDDLTPGGNSFNAGQGALFNLAPTVTPPESYKMDFESVSDFSLSFNDWTVADEDQHDTYVIENHTFPHQAEPMAFLCFNPALVNPSMAGDPSIQPHGGQRFGACFSSNPPSNNDWFISPRIQMDTGGSFSFWIKSQKSTFGLDEYRVEVSTTDNNPASFTAISGSGPLQTTTSWVKKTFSLAAFDNQKIYVAIHCVSNDHFLMMIDDLEVKVNGTSGLKADFTANRTTLMVGESINFTDQSDGSPTTWNWTFIGAAPSVSNVQNPTGIAYTIPGTYPVKLRISNGAAADSVTKTGYITVSGYPSSMSLDFESLSDFTLAFAPWTTIDVKGGNTYGISGVSFPGDNDPMSFICFNPSKTVPALANMPAHGGNKMGCCFSTIPSTPPAPVITPNDKWLITPKMTLGQEPVIEFWVRTYNYQYGYEKYNVAVSTTDLQPSSFVPVTTTPESAPADWTKRTYDLSAYTSKTVYIGIQCVTNDGFIFLLDDISISSPVGTDESRTLSVAVFPNPASGRIIIRPAKPVDHLSVTMVDQLGNVVRTWDNLSGSGNVLLGVEGIRDGLYLLEIITPEGSATKKISILN